MPNWQGFVVVMSKTEPQLVAIPMDGAVHGGNFVVPKGASGLVLFAHGSGSSRLSPRNNFVAHELNQVGIATLLFDLLTADEDRDYQTRFDIDLLTHRLLAATDWLGTQLEIKQLPVAYFGASTGAAAALMAAAELGDAIAAIVSRGGRPDMAGPALPRVKAPTLLIVGGLDDVVIGDGEGDVAAGLAAVDLNR